MNTNATRIRLAALYARVPGVAKGERKMPRNITRAELPLAVVGRGSASYSRDPLGEQYYTRTAVWTVVLFIKEWTGVEGEAEEAVDPLIDAVLDYFMARPGLADTGDEDDIVYLSTITADSGIQAAPVGDASYTAVTFTHEIITQHTISYIV